MTPLYVISRVITPATSQGLITLDQAKVVLGVPDTDTSQDAIITTQIDAVSAAISNYCDRIFVVQTYRDTISQLAMTYGQPLLSRQKPIVAAQGVPTLFTVTVDGGAVAPEQYELDLDNGRAYRLDTGWAGEQILLDYAAGYDPIPPDLQAACNEWLTARWLARGRDPMLRSETVFDVASVVYTSDSGSAGSSGEGPPPGVCAWLTPYLRITV